MTHLCAKFHQDQSKIEEKIMSKTTALYVYDDEHFLIILDLSIFKIVFLKFIKITTFTIGAYFQMEYDCKAHVRFFLRCTYYKGALIFECIQYLSPCDTLL